MADLVLPVIKQMEGKDIRLHTLLHVSHVPTLYTLKRRVELIFHNVAEFRLSAMYRSNELSSHFLRLSLSL